MNDLNLVFAYRYITMLVGLERTNYKKKVLSMRIKDMGSS